MVVKFHEQIDDELLKFAVIAAKSDGKWVFCKHRQRNTLEFPGGHRETDENILDTAKRELYEETGAVDYNIKLVCYYSVTGKNSVSESTEETFGALYAAQIHTFEDELKSEIEKIFFMDNLPDNWTYPLIQPKLLQELNQRNVFDVFYDL